MLQKYRQTTYETCLAVSLLQAVGRVKPVKITRKLELACILHSMMFSRADFAAGHLDFVARRFGVRVLRIVDRGKGADYVKGIKVPNSRTEVKRITLGLVDRLIKESPIILYMDSYALFGYVHLPHFVTVVGKKSGKYRVFDPWSGRYMLLDRETLSRAVSLLRSRIRLVPQVLVVE
ncbi:hypothetical protein HYV82_06440 [Candidatus Woesearchaeota archaeon]|nr:hypothetical protein [Candidatus Woesearchaeota archaeon]